MSYRKVLFVIGNPRSGSTLVTLIAGSHSRAFAIGEAEGIGAALAYQKQNGRATPCLCCNTACPIWDRPDMKAFLAREAAVDQDRAPSLLDRFKAPFYAPIFEATGAEILVDSSKRINWLDRRRANMRDWTDAEPRMLFITRDGRGAVNSWARKFPDRPFEEHVEKWLRNMAEAEAAFDRFPDAQRMRIAYEQVAGDPEAAARRICDFLEVPHEPGMGSYWTHDHHVLRGNAGTLSLLTEGSVTAPARQDFYSGLGQAVRPDETWRDAMSERELEIFEQLAGEANAPYAAQ